LFTTGLDFGAAVFNGQALWLQILVRTNGGGAFTPLIPRQPLTPSPYSITAITASNLSGLLPAGQISGTILNSSLPANPNFSWTVSAGGGFLGNGASVTNVNAAALGGLPAGGFWRLAGNNVLPGQFLGSTNNQAVEIWANGQRALRIDPGPFGAGGPNIIGGSFVNFSSASVGATIAGGGFYNGTFNYTNSVTANYGTVSGGTRNTASFGAVVGGGDGNQSLANYAAVGGGQNNQAIAPDSTVPGGLNNVASGQYSLAAGQQAQAAHQGAFVWADSQPSFFSSTTNDEFSIRAQNGIHIQSDLGIHLTAEDRPIIVRDWDPFLASAPNGKANIGRWGLFMEPTYLTIGIPGDDRPGRYFQIAKYNTDGTSNQLMQVDQSGNLSASNLKLPATSSSAGIIYVGGNRFLHSYGSFNFYAGVVAGNLSQTGSGHNIGIGYGTLSQLTSGADNTAIGVEAIFQDTTGSENTACGVNTMLNNTVGGYNSAYGGLALYNNTSGSYNTAIGYLALGLTFASSNNIAIGYQAGYNLTSGTNNICIGHPGVTADGNTIRIGTNQTRAFVSGIFGATSASGVQVFVNSSGQLGTLTSSGRFKRDIENMDKASDALLSLRPVSFKYKRELDPSSTPQFGLIAEEVAKVDPELVARDDEGRPYTVRYEAVNAMLLNEFLKEHRQVEQQAAELEALRQKAARIDSLEKRLSQLEEILLSRQ
jgi:hypothetical protein